MHVKLDSGMGRLGTRDTQLAARVLELAENTDGVEPIGLMTHFATADELDDDGFFASQLDAFARWAEPLQAANPELIVHAANSAATAALNRVLIIRRQSSSLAAKARPSPPPIAAQRAAAPLSG